MIEYFYGDSMTNQIGNIIKEIRKKNNLTQQEFAEKYHVTYQAVSKWENSKNIPDIAVLKQICDDFNLDIDSLLNGEQISNKKKKNYLIYIILILILLIITIIFIVIINNNHDFKFKTISTNCPNFTISGSIAYNNKKSYLYISNINYCGNEDNEIYSSIECILYENTGLVKRQIDKCNNEDNANITLEEYLKNIYFKVDDFSNNCKHYQEDDLYIEIYAKDKDDKVINYQIPLNLEDECK